jgi:hypothetical protein
MPDPIVDVDYRTHILIGVKASGSMTVICHWSILGRPKYRIRLATRGSPMRDLFFARRRRSCRSPMRATQPGTAPSASTATRVKRVIATP